MPSSVDLILSFFDDLRHDLERISLLGNDVRDADLRRPAPVVIGQEGMVPEARGRVWDLRSTPIRPLDFGAGPRSGFDRARFAKEFADDPDQEMVSFMVHGVQFKAESLAQGLVTVLMPHLGSLRLGFKSVEKEILRLHGLECHDFFSDVPYAPFRLVPQGSTSRKLEPERMRRTSDGGGLRKRPDHPHGSSLSLNAAIDLHGSRERPVPADRPIIQRLQGVGHVASEDSDPPEDAVGMAGSVFDPGAPQNECTA